MATKRKLCEEEIEEEVEKKKARMEDRLANLPHDLQLHILSSLDAKGAAKLSIMSKTWSSLWSWIPNLDFNSYITFYNLPNFDKFVKRVLHLDRSAKLNRLTFTRRGICSPKILENVFDYAFSHGVKQLEANIDNSGNKTWPVCLHDSFESLKSLKLQSSIRISCPFLGQKSRSFKNLTVLYLEGALITDPEPFSSFPALERLTLRNCDIQTEGEILSLKAHNLSYLTISDCKGEILSLKAHNLSYLTISDCKISVNCCELKTPSLRFLEYQGSNFPQFRTHEGLPVLDTMHIGYNGDYHQMQEKRLFDELLSLFCALPNAKSLTLFSYIVDILSLFQNELVKRSSPFQKLKCLTLDFKHPYHRNCFDRPWPVEPYGIPEKVKAYFLQNCPDANVSMIYP